MHHQVKIIETNETELVLVIDGKEVSFLWNVLSPVLATAAKKDRNIIEISPSGYGIHWPTLDEDLSVDGLLGIQHEPHHHQDFA